MQYPADIDAECIPICDALNALSGIDTTESCCGHGSIPHRIFFRAKTVGCLAPILRSCESSAWRVEAGWASGSNTIYFMLEGPIGPPEMPGGANDFATELSDDQRERCSNLGSFGRVAAQHS